MTPKRDATKTKVAKPKKKTGLKRSTASKKALTQTASIKTINSPNSKMASSKKGIKEAATPKLAVQKRPVEGSPRKRVAKRTKTAATPKKPAAKKVNASTPRAKAAVKKTKTAVPKPKSIIKKAKTAAVKKKARAKKPKAATSKTKRAAPKTKAAAKKGKGTTAAVVKYDPLQRYLNEISRYDLITREREVELGILIQEEGDTEAAYELVTSNLRLVVKIALEFQRIWMQNLLDLIQEGNMGLMQAVKKFDPYKNVKFSYYASFWIKAYILKFIMDNWRLVKIGTTQGQRKLFFKLKKEKRRLVEQGFDPKPKLLSERLGVSEKEVVDMDQRLSSWDVSLNAPLKDDSDTTRADLLSLDDETAEDTMAKKEMDVLLHQKIGEFRKQMSERELDIFDRRIFSDTPETLQEIGDRYAISRERVRQVEKNIIKKLRLFFQKEIPDFDVYALAQGVESE